MDTIMLSGGFDPIQSGHARMFKAAYWYGKILVALNSDEWLIRKKGYCFQTWDERAEILTAIANVNSCVHVDDSDGTVYEALRRYRPTYFGNGGDRGKDNTPELKLCEELGITPVFALGGEKISSSSECVREAYKKLVVLNGKDPDPHLLSQSHPG